MDEIIEALIRLERAILSQSPKMGSGPMITEIKVTPPVADFLRYSYDHCQSSIVTIDYRHKKPANYVMSIRDTDIYEDRLTKPHAQFKMGRYHG
tara:strand:- start:53184 stop:53465 length:282 start_codon:yes stop_codon:yes gene_type:complete